MAPAFDSVGPSSSGIGHTGNTALTWTHTTVGASTTILVAVSPDNVASSVPATATCDGTSMTSIGITPSGSGGTQGYLQVFSISGISAGAHTITVTVSNLTNDSTGGSIAFTGVTSLGTAVTNAASANGSTSFITLPTNTSGNIIAGFIAAGNTISAANSPATNEFLNNLMGGTGFDTGNIAGAISNATGSSVTITWPCTSTVAGTLAVELQGATAVMPGASAPTVGPGRQSPAAWAELMPPPATPAPATQVYAPTFMTAVQKGPRRRSTAKAFGTVALQPIIATSFIKTPRIRSLRKVAVDAQSPFVPSAPIIATHFVQTPVPRKRTRQSTLTHSGFLFIPPSRFTVTPRVRVGVRRSVDLQSPFAPTSPVIAVRFSTTPRLRASTKRPIDLSSPFTPSTPVIATHFVQVRRTASSPKKAAQYKSPFVASTPVIVTHFVQVRRTQQRKRVVAFSTGAKPAVIVTRYVRSVTVLPKRGAVRPAAYRSPFVPTSPVIATHYVTTPRRSLLRKVSRFVQQAFVAVTNVVRPPQALGGTASDQNFLGGTAVNANASNAVPSLLGGSAVNANASNLKNSLLGGNATNTNALGGNAPNTNSLGGNAVRITIDAQATGWSMQQQDITIGQYNDETLALTLTSGGSPLNLTGLTIEIYLKPSAASLDTDPGVYKLSTVTGEIVIVSPTGGTANASIASGDIALTSTPAFWRCDVITAGKRNTALYGAVHITDL